MEYAAAGAGCGGVVDAVREHHRDSESRLPGRVGADEWEDALAELIESARRLRTMMAKRLLKRCREAAQPRAESLQVASRLEPDRGGGADAGKDGGGMSEFVQHLEMEGGLAVTTWNDDAPIIGFQVNAFNWRLRRAREAKGWSRAELARQIGLSPGVVGDAERLRPVSDASREKMALALGVPEDILFPGEIDKLPKDGPPQIEISLTREDVTSLAEPDALA
jgi:transcriptional regulator with XRE-family HTH domain